MRRATVLIVGAGLAGCSAAYHLAKQGVEDVIVLERMGGDRYLSYHRTCGEAVSDRMIERSGIPEGCIVRDVRTIRITCGDVDMDIPVKGRIIDRNRLLSDLREGSNAEFIGDSVRTVESTDEGYLVRGVNDEYLCDRLIGADGAFSVVRKAMFGTVPEIRFPAVNNIVKGNPGSGALIFEVSTKYPGAYRWDFPSKDGYRSVGYVNGTEDLKGYEERGIRFIVSGRSRRVVDSGCCIVGDAAMLTNPMCYGGIGASLLSGRKAAEAVAKGDLETYQRWVEREPMFDRHYMDAHDCFKSWRQGDYEDAVRPFKGGYSVLRGAYAMLRRPRWAKVYMAVWMAFRKGW
jgi:flavin-dependent dehydrogenase